MNGLLQVKYTIGQLPEETEYTAKLSLCKEFGGQIYRSRALATEFITDPPEGEFTSLVCEQSHQTEEACALHCLILVSVVSSGPTSWSCREDFARSESRSVAR